MTRENILNIQSCLSGESITQNLINTNTRILHSSTVDIGNPWLLSTLPDKVKTRIAINTHGINNLSTTIITPEALRNLPENVLKETLRFSITANAEIGLPTTNDLIIRTARKNSFLPNASRHTTFSEPALLAMDVGTEKERYKLLVEGNMPRKFASLAQFIGILDTNTYLLVHDDNFWLQKQSVHGRMRISDDNCELIIGIDSLHSRGLGTSDSEAPFIQFNSQYPDYLFRTEPQFIEEFIQQNIGSAKYPRLTLHTERLSPERGAHILEQARTNADQIMFYYEKASEIFGSDCVMEFRLYPSTGEENQQKLHVLDVNTKF